MVQSINSLPNSHNQQANTIQEKPSKSVMGHRFYSFKEQLESKWPHFLKTAGISLLMFGSFASWNKIWKQNKQNKFI